MKEKERKRGKKAQGVRERAADCGPGGFWGPRTPAQVEGREAGFRVSPASLDKSLGCRFVGT